MTKNFNVTNYTMQLIKTQLKLNKLKRTAPIKKANSKQEFYLNYIMPLLEKGFIQSNTTKKEIIEFLLTSDCRENKVKSIVKNMIRKQFLIDSITVIDKDDIFQDLYIAYLNNPQCLDFDFFFGRVKWTIKNCIRKELRRYSKFKANQSIDSDTNNLINDSQLSYTFNYDVITKIDMKDLFNTDIEKQVYKLLLIGYKNREIYDITGCNCQRIIKKVKDKVKDYVVSNSGIVGYEI